MASSFLLLLLRFHELTWFWCSLYVVCSEEQTKTRTLPWCCVVRRPLLQLRWRLQLASAGSASESQLYFGGKALKKQAWAATHDTVAKLKDGGALVVCTAATPSFQQSLRLQVSIQSWPEVVNNEVTMYYYFKNKIKLDWTRQNLIT